MQESDTDEGNDLCGQALPVEKCQFSPAELRRRMKFGIPAATSGEFLMRERLEAESISPKLSNKGYRESGTDAEVSRCHKPLKSSAWSDAKIAEGLRCHLLEDTEVDSQFRLLILNEFVTMREYLFHFDDYVYENKTSIEAVSVKKQQLPAKSDTIAWITLVSTHSPSLSQILNIDHDLAFSVLKKLCCCLEDHVEEGEGLEPCDASATPSCSAEDTDLANKESMLDSSNISGSYSKLIGHIGVSWLFALLSRLQKPLGAGVEAYLRSLARAMLAIRSEENRDRVAVILVLIEDFFEI